MAKNQTGIAIVIKAFLPTGSTIDEQFAALSLVKDAHASSDYTVLLKAAKVDEVKTEQKTRRVDDEPATTAENSTGTAETEKTEDGGERTEDEQPNLIADGPNDAEVPAFLKKGKGKQSSENAAA